MNIKTIMSLVGSTLLAQAVLAADPVVRQAATAKELYEALVELNEKDVRNVIELTGDSYDVSAYHMQTSGDAQKGHLYAQTVTIRGKSTDPRATVIYGNGTDRIIYIRNARLHNLTISNGCASANYGAGVNGQGYTVANAICSNCVITCNDGSAISGGGAGYVTLLDCEVCNNSGKHGGGTAGCVVRGGSIHDNTASQSGGAGLNSTATGVKAYGNTAAKGGCFSSNSACVIDNCEIYGNTATGSTSSEGGGAAMNISSSIGGLTLTNCVVWGNTGVYGGAAHYATLRDCIVSNNVATYGGAGFTVRIYDSTVCSNLATKVGGATYDGLVVGGVLSNNYAVTHSGAVYSSTVSNATVVANVTAGNGAGANSSTLVGCQILRNVLRPSPLSTRADGAGVYGCTVIGGTIAGNGTEGSNNYGGASTDSKLIGCQIHDNFGRVGAALHGGTATDCVISNNATADGTFTIRCTTALTGCTIDAQQLESPGVLMNCTLSGCGKPVILVEGANAVTSGTFTAGSSTYILTGQMQMIAATNCLFSGNNASLLIQGPRNGTNKTLPFVNCTFANNNVDTTIDAVPGTAGKNGSALFKNCLFAENHTLNGTEKRDFSPQLDKASNQITLSNCLIQTPVVVGWSCDCYENIITNSPRFAAKTEWPYSLKRSSPACGKGEVMDWMASATDVRGEGYPRLRDGEVDLGCYQCWLDPVGMMLLLR